MQARFDERRMPLAYRKGGRPPAKEVRPYTCDHPVFQMIQRGDPWLRAWVVQMCTPWSTITRKAKIDLARVYELERGDGPTPAEVEALAALWYVTPVGLYASIEDAKEVSKGAATGL